MSNVLEVEQLLEVLAALGALLRVVDDNQEAVGLVGVLERNRPSPTAAAGTACSATTLQF